KYDGDSTLQVLLQETKYIDLTILLLSADTSTIPWV
ncbi:MAG: hypothetical protein ACI9Y1_003090, partial [Lentisphaeria bacterium]